MMVLNAEIRYEEKRLPLFTANQKKRQALLSPQDKGIASLISLEASGSVRLLCFADV